MKTKFETNVAQELPKTKSSQEPGLPWKVSSEDMDKAASIGSEYKAAISGVPPLKVRAPFLVALILAIFIVMFYFVSTAVLESEKIERAMKTRERAISLIKTDLEEAVSENSELNKNLSELQKKVGELTAQKDLFTAVIESLAKKTDEQIAQSESARAGIAADVKDPAALPNS